MACFEIVQKSMHTAVHIKTLNFRILKPYFLLGEEKYEEILRSMIEKISFGSAEATIQCKICARSFKSDQLSNLKNHIEAKHIDHVKLTCVVCCGIFSSKASFNTHTRNFHKDGNAQFTVTALSEVAE